MTDKTDHTPVVVVHGLGQYESWEVNEKGERLGRAWPLSFDTEKLRKKLVLPAVKMLLTRRDAGFTNKLQTTIRELLDVNASLPDGTPKHNVKVTEYPEPVSRCGERDKKFIYTQVPIKELGETIGEDKLFYFAYNIFGQLDEYGEKLDKFIDSVREKTGHNKVNLIPVSMGGAVTSYYLGHFGGAKLKRVVAIVPAYNGSVMFSDILSGNVNANDYRGFFKVILGEETGEKFAGLLSVVPKKVLRDAVYKTVDGAVEAIIVNSSMMWSLVPAEDYPALREKYLNAPGHERLRGVCDELYTYRQNFAGLLQRMPEVEFFTLCGYDQPIFRAIGDGRKSSDIIVHTHSCSMGAVVAPPGETLPADYVQSRFPEKSLLSPDRKIDASAGALPFTTWYWRGMGHSQSASYRPLLLLAKRLLTEDELHTTADTPEYPQFSVYEA